MDSKHEGNVKGQPFKELQESISKYIEKNPEKVKRVFREAGEDSKSLSDLWDLYSAPWMEYVKIDDLILEVIRTLKKSKIYSPLQAEHIIRQEEQVRLRLENEALLQWEPTKDIKFTNKQKRAIDKELSQYPRWVSIYNRCNDWIQYLEADHSLQQEKMENEQLGATIQKSNDINERVKWLNFIELKRRTLDKKRNEKEYVGHKIKEIESFLNDHEMTDELKQIVNERYFKRKSMDKCIMSIQVLNRSSYKRGIKRIRDIAYKYGMSM